mgnify:CR=1 FL=1
MRANLKAPGNERFRISDSIGVAWEQLVQVDNLQELVDLERGDVIEVSGLSSADGSDNYSFEIYTSPFRIV